MYSKIYRITCDLGKAEGLMAHYDSVLTPAINNSEHHAGHQMIEIEAVEWLLISNYHSKRAAEASVAMVGGLVKPMVEQFGMTLELINEGEVVRTI